MHGRLARGLAVLAVTAGLIGGGAVLANAATGGSSSSSTQGSTTTTPSTNSQHHCPHMGSGSGTSFGGPGAGTDPAT